MCLCAGGWGCSRDQLPFPRRFRGQRVLQCGDILTPASAEGRPFLPLVGRMDPSKARQCDLSTLVGRTDPIKARQCDLSTLMEECVHSRPLLKYIFVVSYLSCDHSYPLQVRYPDRITLIRGNHESRQITQVNREDPVRDLV